MTSGGSKLEGNDLAKCWRDDFAIHIFLSSWTKPFELWFTTWTPVKKSFLQNIPRIWNRCKIKRQLGRDFCKNEFFVSWLIDWFSLRQIFLHMTMVHAKCVAGANFTFFRFQMFPNLTLYFLNVTGDKMPPNWCYADPAISSLSTNLTNSEWRLNVGSRSKPLAKPITISTSAETRLVATTITSMTKENPHT